MKKRTILPKRKKQTGRKSISTKIVLLVLCVCLIPLLISSTLSGFMSMKAGEKNAHEQIADRSQSISSQVSEYINKGYAIVEGLSISDNIALLDPLRQKMLLEKTIANNPYFLLFYEQDMNGDQTARSSGELANRADRWWFIQAVNDKKPFVSKSYFTVTDGAAGAAVTSIVFPVLDEATGAMNGVLAADLNLTKLQEIIDSYNTEETYSVLIDGEGTVIAHPDKECVAQLYNYKKGTKTVKESGVEKEVPIDLTEDFKAMTAKLLGGGSGTEEFVNEAGEEAIYSYAPIAIPGNSDSWGVITVTLKEDAVADSYAMVKAGAVLTVVIAILAVIQAYFIAGRITKPLKRLAHSAEQIAQGDLNVDIKAEANDEIGEVAEAMERTVVRLKSYIDYIDEITSVLNDFSKGILVFELHHDYAGEFARIKDALYEIGRTMSSTLFNIREVAEEVNGNAANLSSGAQSLAQGTTEQASSIQELSATISEISEHVNKTAENAENAKRLTREVGTEIETGNQQMQKMTQAMQEIADSSREIGKIIKTIDDIAFQTNILALNAAVEAARAGSAGKGFAVVADEVRNLAQKSAESANNTTALIEQAVKAVENGITIVGETAQSLNRIVEGSEETAKLVEEIAAASGEQASSIAQVTIGVEQVSAVVQTNSATAEESAATSSDLSGKAERLNELVGKFHLNIDK